MPPSVRITVTSPLGDVSVEQDSIVQWLGDEANRKMVAGLLEQAVAKVHRAYGIEPEVDA